MRRSFDAAARRRIQAALNARPEGSREPIACPACGAPLTESPIGAPAGLPYVRRRVMVVCTSCGSGAAVDVKAAGRP